MRTIAYDVIGVNVFLLTLMRFLLKKVETVVHPILLLQLSMPILCVVWLVCFSYKPYFSQIKQLVCGMWESRDYIPAGHHQ